MQITAKRQRQGGWKREISKKPVGGGKAEAFRRGPNKTTRGDLKGKEADVNGSESEVTDLEKGGAEASEKQTAETAKTLPQKVEGTKALGG